MSNIPQKIQFLKYVAEQGIASAQDINDYFFKEDKVNVIISTLYQLGLSRMIYGTLQGGLWQIDNPKLYQLLATYYHELHGLKVRSVSAPLIQHFLEMNRVRTAIERYSSQDIALWVSQRQIYAIRPKERLHFCPLKPPDAVFWINAKEGGQKKYFLICERHYNSTPKRYMEIFESYSKRSDVKDRNVLFLCGYSELRNKLISIGSKSIYGVADIQFVTLKNFYDQYSSKAEVKPDARLEPVQAV